MKLEFYRKNMIYFRLIKSFTYDCLAGFAVYGQRSSGMVRITVTSARLAIDRFSTQILRYHIILGLVNSILCSKKEIMGPLIKKFRKFSIGE